MTVTFDPIVADYVAASRANYLNQIGRWQGRTRLLSVVAVLVLAVVASDYGHTEHVDHFWPLWLLCLAILVPVGIGAKMLLIPGRVRRLFADQPGYREPMRVAWSEQDSRSTAR